MVADRCSATIRIKKLLRALHLYLEGEGAPPHLWTVGEVCRAFSCMPSQALREDPEVCLSIMSLRAYADAYHTLDRAKSEADVPPSAMVDLVFDIRSELHKETIACRTTPVR